MTPLHVAAGSRLWRVVQILLAAGADISLTDSSGRTPYDLAVEEKAPDNILQLLIPPQPVSSSRAVSQPFSAVVVNESMTVNLRDDV